MGNKDLGLLWFYEFRKAFREIFSPHRSLSEPLFFCMDVILLLCTEKTRPVDI